MSEQKESPFRTLGRQLKALRNRASESIAEASGAVEIDVEALANFELGKSRPSEDVLLLLISHFGAKDDEAVRLWEMAGYGLDKIPVTHNANEEIQVIQATMQLPEPRILFTDIVDVTVNNYGVVMSFMQGATPNTKPVSVAKVGMSREHAKSVLQILKATIDQTEQTIKNLPQASPSDTKTESK